MRFKVYSVAKRSIGDSGFWSRVDLVAHLQGGSRLIEVELPITALMNLLLLLCLRILPSICNQNVYKRSILKKNIYCCFCVCVSCFVMKGILMLESIANTFQS